MSVVGERLREAMARRDVDQPTLAAAVGCTQGAISQILTGDTQRSRFLPEIADYLGVPLRWLRGDIDHFDFDTEPSQRQMLDRLNLVSIERIDMAYGLGGTFSDVPIEREIEHFPRKWIESITHTPPSKLTFTLGKGDSMRPTIQDGDMVLIDRSQRSVHEQDAHWALTIGDVGMIKRLRVRGETVTILSDNKEVPPDTAHPDEINIVGRVIFIGRRV